MAKLTPDTNGQFQIPSSFFQRRRLDPNTEFWLDEREGDIILHPRIPDAKKLYIEVTTACNLNCQTCIRHSWTDPHAHMSVATYKKILESLDELPM